MVPHRYTTDKGNFNPRSPCGERPCTVLKRSRPRNFNPRSPCGERQEGGQYCPAFTGFQSTLSLRRAT